MPRTMPFVEVLSQEQVRLVHLQALRVLEEVGMWLPNRQILERLADAGARVDFDTGRVLFPAHLVEGSIQKFPSRFTWPARNPAYSIDLNGVDTYFSFPDSAINVIDGKGRRRPGVAKDGEDICRLCDALPNLAVTSCGVTPPDMPSDVLEAWFTRTVFTYSSKPVFGVCRNAGISHMILRMAEVVADSCNMPKGVLPLVIIMNPVSPLYNTPGQLEGLVEYLPLGLPVSISPEVQAGATGPATLAGVMVQQTAEFLAHATLIQVFKPGTPVMYGTVSSVFDMRKMLLPYGAPEADLLAIATVQMARYYGIPSRTTGGSSDSFALNMQAGIDSLMSTMLPIMAGSTFVLHAAGELENTLAVSYEKIVIDEEIISMARRIVEGIQVTPDTLAFDVIKEVGPQGNFLGTTHTMKHFRQEQFMPAFMVRDPYDVWEAAGGRHAEERAMARAAQIIATHQPEPLPEPAAAELEAIYQSVLKCGCA